MTDHPLTENDIIERWNKDVRIARWDMLTSTTRAVLLAYFRDTYNDGREHERANPEDDRPWEPLDVGDPLNVGDEVRQEVRNLTITAVVARVGAGGDLWAAEGGYIGRLKIGTWYVRRPILELPTETTTVIIPNDGHQAIKATVGKNACYASEAMLGSDGRWYGVWRRHDGQPAASSVAREEINSHTWKVEEK